MFAQAYPDFLSSWLASANLMRLSLMKAAHAGVGGAPWQEIRVRGLKTTGRSPFQCFYSITHPLYTHTRLDISPYLQH
jgi:hypothetical protein